MPAGTTMWATSASSASTSTGSSGTRSPSAARSAASPRWARSSARRWPRTPWPRPSRASSMSLSSGARMARNSSRRCAASASNPSANACMARLIKGRVVVADNEWTLAGGEGVADATHLILPLEDYIKAIEAGEPADRRAPLLQARNVDISALRPYLHRVPLVAIDFTTTGDGRGFTQAQLLRGRFGYRGELRAVGKIRADQMFFLARCGFDAFELLDDEDPDIALA